MDSQTDTPPRAQLLAVARQERPPDLVVRGGTVANVYSGEWLRWNVEVCDGRIAYVGPRSPVTDPSTRELDASGKVVAPGYIEPHFHPVALYNPASLLELALPTGTATIVNDNLFFFLPLGTDGFRRVVDAVNELPGHNYWVARVASQSGFAEEAEVFGHEAIAAQLEWPEVLATGEATRWIDIVRGSPRLLTAFETARRLGRRVDGHAAGASFDRLAALAGAGVSADHEAITGDEALSRLRLGLWTLLRGSSLRRDLPELVRAIGAAAVDTRRVMLTTDGSGPSYLADHGMVDDLLRLAVAEGMDAMTALQAATVNPATFLGLDQELGGVAPGRRATLLVLAGPAEFRPETVLVDGEIVARDGRLTIPRPAVDWAGLGASMKFGEMAPLADPRLYPLPAAGAEATVPVMRYESAVISRRDDRALPVRDGRVDLSDAADCVHAVLVDRLGRWIVRGVVADLFPGAAGMASTYTTSGHILVFGRSPAAMAVAATEVVRLGGGIAIAGDDTVTWSAPLAVVGTGSTAPFAEAVAIERTLFDRVADLGYPFHDALYTLLFMTCDFLPEVRLTPAGLLEVKRGTVLEPARPLG
jgi:adenine deaminase